MRGMPIYIEVYIGGKRLLIAGCYLLALVILSEALVVLSEALVILSEAKDLLFPCIHCIAKYFALD